jgi:hypothetical protein
MSRDCFLRRAADRDFLNFILLPSLDFARRATT